MRKIIYLLTVIFFTFFFIFEYTVAFKNRIKLYGIVERVIIDRTTTMTVKLDDGRYINVNSPYVKANTRVVLSCFEGGLSGKLYCDYTFAEQLNY
ncbi:MAG: hypothetical protein OQJ80_03085 [Kangiella sp.]|nr:hypothetical protein [Kangiella sp.]